MIRTLCLALALLLSLPGLAAPATSRFVLPDMDCPSCAVTVKVALSRLPGVEQVEVDPRARQVTVRYDDARISAGQIRQRLADAGYPPRDGGQP